MEFRSSAVDPWCVRAAEDRVLSRDPEQHQGLGAQAA
ncbi:hypothetical protein [Caudoviricetes sp.]|nr:hypothetical protein [Caudoviricetes sp.]